MKGKAQWRTDEECIWKYSTKASTGATQPFAKTAEFIGLFLLPFDGGGGLIRNIINTSIHTLHFINNPTGNFP